MLKDFIRDSFPLAVVEIPGHADYPIHSHDYLELVLVYEGFGVHAAGGMEYRIGAGDAFVITGGLEHGYRDSNHLRFANILFDFKGLGLPMHDLRTLPGFHALFELEPRFREKHEFRSRLKLSRSDIAHVRRLAGLMRAELSRREPGYKDLCVGVLLELFVFLSRAYSEAPTPEREAVYNFGRVISCIEDRYSQDISLGSLAKLANMSVRNFQRSFKKTFESSPINYLLNLRISKACEALLAFPDVPVSEISAKAGFDDSNYFARQFKRVMKMSPREYRRRMSPVGEQASLGVR